MTMSVAGPPVTPSPELAALLRHVKDLPEPTSIAFDPDAPAPAGSVHVMHLVDVEPTRAGVETAISKCEHKIARPGGLIVFHRYYDARMDESEHEGSEYSDAIGEWLRRRSEFWQAISHVGTQLIVRARARR